MSITIGLKQDGEEKELNPMEAALQVFSEEYRKDDMMKAAEQEMSINDAAQFTLGTKKSIYEYDENLEDETLRLIMNP